MKKGSLLSTVIIVIAVVVAIQIIIGLCFLIFSRSGKAQKEIVPENGVYYCDELLTVIDFAAMNERGYTDCAIRYTDTSEKFYENVYPKITQGGNTIGIEAASLGSFEDYRHYYVTGVCDYSDGTFRIISEDPEIIYTFIKTDEHSVDDLKRKAEPSEDIAVSGNQTSLG